VAMAGLDWAGLEERRSEVGGVSCIDTNRTLRCCVRYSVFYGVLLFCISISFRITTLDMELGLCLAVPCRC